MHYEKVNENIEVLVHFASNQIHPLRFLWKQRPHRVLAVRGKWVTLEGTLKCIHYAIEAAGVGCCELAFDVDKMEWRLKSIAVES